MLSLTFMTHFSRPGRRNHQSLAATSQPLATRWLGATALQDTVLGPALRVPKTHASTILFKIITRMKLLFSKYLGDYSYSFQGSSELISITVTVSLFFLQNGVTGNNFPQEFPRIFGNYSYMI